MAHEVRCTRVESSPLAVIRRQARQNELPRLVPEGCGIVWNALKAHGIKGAGRHVAIYWDNRITLEVGVEIGSSFSGAGEVVRSDTPAGTVATVQHVGPYQLLHEAHDAIRQWCTENGRALAGPSWEIYDHWQKEWDQDPSRIRTEVVYLLE